MFSFFVVESRAHLTCEETTTVEEEENFANRVFLKKQHTHLKISTDLVSFSDDDGSSSSSFFSPSRCEYQEQ